MLIDGDKLVNTREEIEKICLKFYKELYTREDLDQQALEKLELNLNSLDEIDSDLCELPLTEAECLRASNEM